MTKLFINSDLPKGVDSGPLGCIILGHASYKTTQRYAHIAPQLIKTATENVAKEIGMALTDE